MKLSKTKNTRLNSDLILTAMATSSNRQLIEDGIVSIDYTADAKVNKEVSGFGSITKGQ